MVGFVGIRSLADTWIAGEDEWTYLDAEAERVAGAGGLKVAASCVHTGGREPAWRLRNKIRGLEGLLLRKSTTDGYSCPVRTA